MTNITRRKVYSLIHDANIDLPDVQYTKSFPLQKDTSVYILHINGIFVTELNLFLMAPVHRVPSDRQYFYVAYPLLYTLPGMVSTCGSMI